MAHRRPYILSLLLKTVDPLMHVSNEHHPQLVKTTKFKVVVTLAAATLLPFGETLVFVVLQVALEQRHSDCNWYVL